MRRLLSLAVLLLALSQSRAEVVIIGVDRIPSNGIAHFFVKDAKPETVRWKIFPKPVTKIDLSGHLIFRGVPGTVYTAYVDVIDFTAKTAEGSEIEVTFEGDAPVPPIPPGPNPPVPPVPPIPVPTGDLRVLFVYESSGTMTRGQLNVWNSTSLRIIMNASAVKENGLPGYRFWDKDQDVSRESETWRTMWEKSKPFDKLPMVVIFKGTTGTAAPLPETESEMLELLKKYGGK